MASSGTTTQGPSTPSPRARSATTTGTATCDPGPGAGRPARRGHRGHRPDNGCPHVVPGLHRRGTLEHHYVDPLGWECLDDPPGGLAAPVAAGGAVVFSSLTPHLTGPNLSDDVRKAYIVQYAPDGAERLEGEPSAGPPTARVPCDATDRQFPVVVGGRPVH